MCNEMSHNGQDCVRVNLVLTGDLSRWLDEQAASIQQATGAAVNRSALVRAALRALRELDPARFKPRNEDQLAAVLIATLRAGRQVLRW
jgi:Arc/MetJ-type ribon-helix-helix transcriptional regulator